MHSPKGSSRGMVAPRLPDRGSGRDVTGSSPGRRARRVSLAEAVLATGELAAPVLDEDASEGERLRARVARALFTTRAGIVYDCVHCLLALLGCMAYVVGTYREDLTHVDLTAEALAAALSVDLVVDALLAERAVRPSSAFMALSVVAPLVAAGRPRDLWGLALRSPMLLHIVRLRRAARLWLLFESAVRRQVVWLAVTVLSLVVLSSGLLHLVENTDGLTADPPAPGSARDLPLHDVVYVIVMTVTTVGYGDIVPETALGRSVIMLMMVTALVVVPQQSRRLVAIMGQSSVYERAHYRRPEPHVLLTGYLRGASVSAFFTELYHADHGGTANVHTVALAAGPPGPHMYAVLADPIRGFAVTYIDGDVLSPYDLGRAEAWRATMLFVLTNKTSHFRQRDDASAIFRVVAIARFRQECGVDAPLAACAQLLRPEAKALMRSSLRALGSSAGRVQQLCVHELKMGLLGKSVLVPGIVPLLCNLISSDTESTRGEQPDGPSAAAGGDPYHVPLVVEQAREEYEAGCELEIYRVPLADSLRGRVFVDAAFDIYERTGVLLFALEVDSPRDESLEPFVVLNPAGADIPKDPHMVLHGFVLAEDRAEAMAVSEDLLGSSGGGGGGGGGEDYDDDDDLFSGGRNRDSLGEHDPALLAATQGLNAEDSVRGASVRVQDPPAAASSADDEDEEEEDELDRVLIDDDEVAPEEADHTERGSTLANLLGRRVRFQPGQRRPELSAADVLKAVGAGRKNKLQRRGAPRDDAAQVLRSQKRLSWLSERRRFYVRSRAASLAESTLRRASDLVSNVRGHVLVTGDAADVVDLVRPLRRRNQPTLHPIIIMAPTPPAKRAWAKVSRFLDVFYLCGNPLDDDDLERASVDTAAAVVILSTDRPMVAPAEALGGGGPGPGRRKAARKPRARSDLADAAAVFTYHKVRRRVPQVLVDVVDSRSLSLLAARDEDLFAAGDVYLSSVMDTLACQAFYNPHLLTIVQQLLVGADARVTASWKRKRPRVARRLPHATLYQVRVPPELDGASYLDVFDWAAAGEGMLPLGLFRRLRRKARPFAFTNPPADTRVTRYDRVFVLGHGQARSRWGFTRQQRDRGGVVKTIITDVADELAEEAHEMRSSLERLMRQLRGVADLRASGRARQQAQKAAAGLFVDVRAGAVDAPGPPLTLESDDGDGGSRPQSPSAAARPGSAGDGWPWRFDGWAAPDEADDGDEDFGDVPPEAGRAVLGALRRWRARRAVHARRLFHAAATGAMLLLRRTAVPGQSWYQSGDKVVYCAAVAGGEWKVLLGPTDELRWRQLLARAAVAGTPVRWEGTQQVPGRFYLDASAGVAYVDPSSSQLSAYSASSASASSSPRDYSALPGVDGGPSWDGLSMSASGVDGGPSWDGDDLDSLPVDEHVEVEEVPSPVPAGRPARPQSARPRPARPQSARPRPARPQSAAPRQRNEEEADEGQDEGQVEGQEDEFFGAQDF